jgi:hypothetical protein
LVIKESVNAIVHSLEVVRNGWAHVRQRLVRRLHRHGVVVERIVVAMPLMATK